jgi:hypothetical protein
MLLATASAFYMIKRMRRNLFTLLALLAYQAVGLGQNVTLSIGSGSTETGGTISLPLNLAVSGESKTAALQWTFSYSSDIATVNVTVGPSAINAGKSVSCSANKCLIFGSTKNVIGDGTVALAVLKIAPNPSKKAITIQVINVVAATASGSAIRARGSSGIISVR